MAALRFRRFRLGKSRKPRRLLGVRPLPTMVTLGNLMCGLAAIVLAMRVHNPPPNLTSAGCLQWAGIMVFLAMVFDVLDGGVARWTKSTSSFGLQMDSLCDVVSFGVAPVVLVKAAIDHVGPSMGYPILDRYVWLMMGVYVACTALRLGRYNVEAEAGHKDFFYGLPSPAAAGCAAGLVVLIAPVAGGGREAQAVFPLLANVPSLAFLQTPVFGQTVLLFFPFFLLCLGILMVSRVHYVHLGDRLLRGRKSFMHLLILGLGLVLIVMQHEIMLAFTFNAYMLIGLVNELRYRFFPKQRPPEWIESSEGDLAASAAEAAAPVEAVSSRATKNAASGKPESPAETAAAPGDPT